MSDLEQRWRTTFGNLLGGMGQEEREETLEKLVEGLESMTTKSSVIHMVYDDKEMSLSTKPSEDELMFFLFDRRRR
jgi:hypothetical protein